MSEKQKYTIIRFAIIFGIILLGYIAVIAKVFVLQTKEREKWLKVAEKRVKTNQPIRATRGNIIDCEGRLLCSSMPQYQVYIDAGVTPLHANKDSLFKLYVNDLAKDFSRIIGDHDVEHYKSLLIKGHKEKRRSIRVSMQRINYNQRKELEQNPLVKQGPNISGVTFKEVKRRIKPYNTLASRTLGSINPETGHGKTGLEAGFDKILCGEDGISTLQYIAGKRENITVRDAVDGKDIIVTLDANLQDIVESVLREQLTTTDAEWGCCALMETKTGHIKAMANLDRQPDDSYLEQLNHMLILVEPGSTFKTISMMAALETKRKNLYDTVSVTKDLWKYYSVTHSDSHPKDTVYTLRSAMAVSSNIALAKVTTEVFEGSAKKYVEQIRKLGIADSFRFEIPGAQYSLIRVPDDAVTVSKMSYGYSVMVTPLQLLMFYNAIANNGKMVRPQLVTEIQQDGVTLRTFETEVVRKSICSKQTLRDIQACLHDVVWDNDLGTASVLKWKGKIVRKKAQSDLVHIAGKTGTAQIPVNGSYKNSRDKHRLIFVGYFPEENPQYTCVFVLNHPLHWPNYDAGGNCGTAVRQIAEKTIAYTGCYKREGEELKLIQR